MNLMDIVNGVSSSGALQDAASQAGVDPSQAQTLLQGVLEHVNNGGSLDEAADAVAAKVGVDPALVQQFLPQVAGLLQGHAANAPDEAQGLIGGLLGAL
ncbi:MAG TPA: hypothetical protein VGL58_08505 [Caulobacteraceae bacterium]|jgi:hypothetical protein